MPIRHLATLPLCAALLAACGSAPPPVPATVTNTRNFMAEGMADYGDNRYAEARGFFGRAYMQYRSLDDQQGQADTLIDLADSALLQGDVPAARQNLADAHALVDAHASLAALKPRLALMDAYADLQSGDPATAASLLDDVLAENGLAPDTLRAALLARTQAAFDAKAGDASQWLAKVGAPGNTPLDAARVDRLQALATPDASKAIALYGDALRRYQSVFYRPGIAATLEEWGTLLVAHQDWPGAHDRLQRALHVRLWMYDGSHSARILDQLAGVDRALGDAAAAQQDGVWADYLRGGGDPSKSPVMPSAVLAPSN